MSLNTFRENVLLLFCVLRFQGESLKDILLEYKSLVKDLDV